MSREAAAGWAPRREQTKVIQAGKPGEWTIIKGKRRGRRTKSTSPEIDQLEEELDEQEEEIDDAKPKEDPSDFMESEEPVLQSSHPPLLPTPHFSPFSPPLRASEKRVKQKGSSVVCRYYLQGFCRDGKHCNFVHALFPQPLKRSQTQPNHNGSSMTSHRRSASDLQSENYHSEDENPSQVADPHLQERGTPPNYHSDTAEEGKATFSSGRSTTSDSGSDGSNGPSEHSSHSFAASSSIPIPLPPGLPSHSSPLLSSFSPESLGGLSGFSSNYSHILSEPSPTKIHSELEPVTTRSLSVSNTPTMSSWTLTHSPRSNHRESPLLSVSAPGSFGSPSFLSLPPPKLFSVSDSRWGDKEGFSLEENPGSSTKYEELEDDALHADLDLKLVELALVDGPESELLDQHPSTVDVGQTDTETFSDSGPFSKESMDPRGIAIPTIETFESRTRSHSLQPSAPTEFSFSSHTLSTSAPLSYTFQPSPPSSPPSSPREKRSSSTSKKEGIAKSKSKSPRLDSTTKSKKVCSFFLQGICRYGTACRHRHQHVVSDQCLSCGNNVGMTLKEQKQHLQSCAELTLLNKEKKLSATKKCCLCSQYTAKIGRKFGLLISCNHAFCLQCIREYRGSSDRPSIRACPKCKVTSHYVIPCDRYVSETSRKEKVISEYKKRLGQIDCKHYNKGKSACPFGDACFYRHSTTEEKTTRTPLKKSQSHPPSLTTTPLSSPLLYSRSQLPKSSKFQSYSPISKDKRLLLQAEEGEGEDTNPESETNQRKEHEGLKRENKNGKNLKFVKSTKQSASASSTPIFRPLPTPSLATGRKDSTTAVKKSKKFVELNGKQSLPLRKIS